MVWNKIDIYIPIWLNSNCNRSGLFQTGLPHLHSNMVKFKFSDAVWNHQPQNNIHSNMVKFKSMQAAGLDKIMQDLHSNMVKFKYSNTFYIYFLKHIYIPIWLNSNASSFEPLYFKSFIYLFCRSHFYLLLFYNIFYKSQAIFSFSLYIS